MQVKFLPDIEIVADIRFPLAQALGDYFEINVIRTDLSKFADTESIVYVKEPQRIKGKVVILVQQFSFFERSFDNSFVCKSSINDQLVHGLLLAHQIKSYRAQSVISVMPYLPYSRQSRSTCGTYIGPLQAIGLFCKAAKIEQVFSCELHEILCKSIFPLPLHEISLKQIWHKVLVENLNEGDIKKICFVSPDRGGINRVKQMAHLFNVEWAFVEKKRIAYDKSVALKLVGDVNDKIVVIIDDIIDTGITAVKATDMVFDHGAKRVICCFTHGIFSDGAVDRIENSNIERVFISNSVLLDKAKLGSKVSIVSIYETLCNYLDSSLKKG